MNPDEPDYNPGDILYNPDMDTIFYIIEHYNFKWIGISELQIISRKEQRWHGYKTIC